MIERKRSEFVALNSLRGICATLVVFFHFEGDSIVRQIPLIANGFLFVDFFFVLSGFVLAASYSAKIASGYPIQKFLFLRLGRIYPLHAAILIGYVVIAFAKYYSNSSTWQQGYTSPGFLISSFLLQAWTPDGFDMGHSWNPPSWSISAEWWTYCVFAIVCRATKRSSIAFMALIGCCLPILIFGSDRYLFVTFSGVAVVRCIFGFSFGFLTYQILGSGRLNRFNVISPATANVTEICVAFACLFAVSVAGASAVSLLCPLLFAASVAVFSFERGLLSRLLMTKPLVLIGALSYSIYMTHDFLLARYINAVQFLSKHDVGLPVTTDPVHPFALFNATGWSFGSDLMLALFYLIVVLVSLVTYHLIEAPFREKSRAIVAGRPSTISIVV